jgi:hypothetical protein
MNPVPEPAPDATPVNEPVSVRLDVGEQATVTFETVQSVSDLMVPIVAISKHPESVYKVSSDGTRRYGPADIPPTDVDDLSVCFVPALRFDSKLTVEVTNLSSSTRNYHIQPVGWEPFGGTNGA